MDLFIVNLTFDIWSNFTVFHVVVTNVTKSSLNGHNVESFRMYAIKILIKCVCVWHEISISQLVFLFAEKRKKPNSSKTKTQMSQIKREWGNNAKQQ